MSGEARWRQSTRGEVAGSGRAGGGAGVAAAGAGGSRAGRWDAARMVRGADWARGEARVAEDSDFETLKTLLASVDGWTLEYEKDGIKVWTENAAHGALRTVKVVAEFPDVSPEALYDVLHDPEYRTVWDAHMLAAEDAGHINVNNDVGYYAMSCPAPLKNRDFVLQRSWLDTGDEKMILNHSVFHKDYPPRKGFVRAQSLLTGFTVRTAAGGGSWLGYVSRSDPRGALPAWLVNRVTAQLAPRLVHQLHAAARKYPGWKNLTDTPYYKPWRHPEQVPPHRINLADCVDPDAPVAAPEPRAEPSTARLLPVPPRAPEAHSVEDLGDLSSEFSVEVEEDSLDQAQDPIKKRGKFYRLVKTMKNRRKSVQVAKSADDLQEVRPEERPEKAKKGFKFHRRFSVSRGRED
ncbi:START domain-containing protein 10 isoform X2 [Plutella xylostella]|uniref:START domain-containing protein 10 isoform X2 n=1 Tax=Plutella xylostella TaxID=51655 RepID=UPI002032D936|nr:START domain-containing protein 10 isoform X2 [Plutella xylostella]